MLIARPKSAIKIPTRASSSPPTLAGIRIRPFNGNRARWRQDLQRRHRQFLGNHNHPQTHRPQPSSERHEVPRRVQQLLGTATTKAATLTVAAPLSLASPAHVSPRCHRLLHHLSALATDSTGHRRLTYRWSVLTSPSVPSRLPLPATHRRREEHHGDIPQARRLHLPLHHQRRQDSSADHKHDGYCQANGHASGDHPALACGCPRQSRYRLRCRLRPIRQALPTQPAIDYSIALGLGQIDSTSGIFTASPWPGPVVIQAEADSLRDIIDARVG